MFPKGAVVISMEAGSVLGWERYAHASIGMTSFGASAPSKVYIQSCKSVITLTAL